RAASSGPGAWAFTTTAPTRTTSAAASRSTVTGPSRRDSRTRSLMRMAGAAVTVHAHHHRARHGRAGPALWRRPPRRAGVVHRSAPPTGPRAHPPAAGRGLSGTIHGRRTVKPNLRRTGLPGRPERRTAAPRPGTPHKAIEIYNVKASAWV